MLWMMKFFLLSDEVEAALTQKVLLFSINTTLELTPKVITRAVKISQIIELILIKITQP